MVKWKEFLIASILFFWIVLYITFVKWIRSNWQIFFMASQSKCLWVFIYQHQRVRKNSKYVFCLQDLWTLTPSAHGIVKNGLVWRILQPCLRSNSKSRKFTKQVWYKAMETLANLLPQCARLLLRLFLKVIEPDLLILT